MNYILDYLNLKRYIHIIQQPITHYGTHENLSGDLRTYL